MRDHMPDSLRRVEEEIPGEAVKYARRRACVRTQLFKSMHVHAQVILFCFLYRN